MTLLVLPTAICLTRSVWFHPPLTTFIFIRKVKVAITPLPCIVTNVVCTVTISMDIGRRTCSIMWMTFVFVKRLLLVCTKIFVAFFTDNVYCIPTMFILGSFIEYSVVFKIFLCVVGILTRYVHSVHVEFLDLTSQLFKLTWSIHAYLFLLEPISSILAALAVHWNLKKWVSVWDFLECNDRIN